MTKNAACYKDLTINSHFLKFNSDYLNYFFDISKNIYIDIAIEKYRYIVTSFRLSATLMSTMHLESLNIDVLLHLLEFVDPVDRFNLILSGILKGFDNVNKGMDLRKR